MSFVGKVRLAGPLLHCLAVIVGASALGGCLETQDPAVPCQAVDLSAPDDAAWLAPASAVVLALAGQDVPTAVFPVCDQGSCELTRAPLVVEGRRLAAGSQVMVTSAGNYIVGVDRLDGALMSWRRQQDALIGSIDEPTEGRITRLVSTFRGSDVVLARDAENRLVRFMPGTQTATLITEDPAVHVLAVGERHVITREVIDGETELISAWAAFDASPEKTPLVQARGLTRVALFPGDDTLALTTDADGDAETLLFDLGTGDLTDRFAGALVAGHPEKSEIPGLSAVSPSATHLAYRTNAGSLALRSVRSAGSCLIRSATAGDHRLAGFAADGLLYVEAVRGGSSQGERSRVFTFDALTRALTALGPADEGFHLAAAPAHAHESVGAWAVGVRDGIYYGLAGDQTASALGIDDAGFMPRTDGAVWAVESMGADPDGEAAAGGERILAIRTIAPVASDEGTSFPLLGHSAYPHLFGGAMDLGPFLAAVGATEFVCMSTGVPGGWASRCGRAGDSTFLKAASPPRSEDPHAPDVPDPQLPPTDN